MYSSKFAVISSFPPQYELLKRIKMNNEYTAITILHFCKKRSKGARRFDNLYDKFFSLTEEDENSIHQTGNVTINVK